MQVANLEDVFKLSPVQQEMLARALDHPRDGADVVQLCVAVSGPLSLPALEAAWERVTRRHAALRTSFRPGKVPFQLVQRQVKLPFTVQDGRHDEEIASFLRQDRARGLDPVKGPLVRLTVLRAAPGEHLLVWTYHRLVLDGWSAALVAGEVLAPGGDDSPAERFRAYIDWLGGQDTVAAERFRGLELPGPDDSPPLGSREPLPGRTGRDEWTVYLGPDATAALQALSDEQGISLEALAVGAWALLLSRHGGRRDLVLGLTVAGRTAPLPEMGSRVGRFAHTLPLRVPVEGEEPLLTWLRRLDEQRTAAEAHPPVSLPRGQVHTRVAVERFPPWPEGVREARWIAACPEPLALIVQPGTELALRLVYDRSRFREEEIQSLPGTLRAMLESFAAGPGRPVSEVAAALPSRLHAPESPRRLDAIARRAGQGALAGRDDLGGHEIVPVPRDRPLPATFYQEWALQLDGIGRNTIPNALRIAGPVDLTALGRSLTEIVRRHESLRTSFSMEGGEARLVIAPAAEVPLPLIDLAALPGERRLEQRQRLIAEHGALELDIARGPLLLAQVLRLDGREHVLLLNIHHLVSDGWSLQVLSRELMILYAAFSQGRPSPLPPLPIQLADFAHWQRRVFAGEALAAHLDWWRRNLANHPPPPGLPIDLPRPEALTGGTVDLALVLPPERTRALLALAQATRSSLPMVLLTAVNALLHAYGGQEDLIVSLIFAARNRVELSEQIGLYMNTVPLRVDLSGGPSFRQLAERVRLATFDAYSHQDVPFPRLLAELFPGRKLTRTLLSGVCFNMLSYSEPVSLPADGTASPRELTLQWLTSEEGPAKHDLVFTCTEGAGALHVALSGAACLFTPERLRLVVQDFEDLLTRLAADPEVRLQALKDVVRVRVQDPAALSRSWFSKHP